jgi:4,5-dihydroxyphthalate decarboxylase
MAAQLQLTLACGDYDRIRPLIDGTVKPEGVDLIYLPLSPEEIFWRMIRFKEFHVAEMSFSSYLIYRSKGMDDFIAIPVFPSRIFRHSSIYINTRSGIKKPSDLINKRMGVPEYQMTAAVWARGILQHEYGISPKHIVWFTGGLEHPGREEKIPLSLPSSIRISQIPPEKTLSQMLEKGEIDALIGPRPPSSYRGKRGNVKRLFEDFEKEEIRYYQKNKIFPIMHTIVIRQDIDKSYPWVAETLYKAFCLAKEICFQKMAEAGTLKYSLPWLISEIMKTREIMGEDFWPYGIEKNLKVIKTLIQYLIEQGLIKKEMEIEEIFAKSTLTGYKV